MQILQALASNMEFMDEFKSSSLHFSKKIKLSMHILHYNYKKIWVKQNKIKVNCQSLENTKNGITINNLLNKHVHNTILLSSFL